MLSAGLLGDGAVYRQRYSYHVSWNRLMNVLSSAFDSLKNHRGRSCPYDCGPHASCRCGVCVSGGDHNACALPSCSECTHTLITTVIISVIIAVILIAQIIFAMLKVMHGMNRRGRVDGPANLCCLLNPRLYFDQGSRRRSLLCCGLPPIVHFVVAVVMLLFFLQLALYAFKDVADDVTSTIDEEYFPSDHRLLYVECDVKS